MDNLYARIVCAFGRLLYHILVVRDLYIFNNLLCEYL